MAPDRYWLNGEPFVLETPYVVELPTMCSVTPAPRPAREIDDRPIDYGDDDPGELW